MNADMAFQMGSSHSVCQDYAAAGALPPDARSGGRARPYAVLSDGCSSSPDTDIGARLLVKAAELLLATSAGPAAEGLPGLHEEAARLALGWAGTLGLSPRALDATLLTAHLDGGELVVGCSGDGAVCLRTRAGALDVYSIEYPSGYPLYPSYVHQPGRLRALREAGRARKEVRRFHTASVEEGLRPAGESGGERVTETFSVRAADYGCAALFSDGVHSFFQEGRAEEGGVGEAVPLDPVLRELVSFKNTRGAFVGRRLKRFLRDCRRRGWRHADDLAVGALHLGGGA